MGQKHDGGKPKIVLKAKPVLPASAKPDPDKLYDVDKLSSLSRPELIAFVAAECRSHRITNPTELLSSAELKPLASVAKLAGIVEDVFRESQTRVEKSPHGIERSTVRPPPRQPPDPPPVSESVPVSGFDATVAVKSDQQPVPSRPPPAPKTLPPPPKFDLINLDAEEKKIVDDNRLKTRQTYDKFSELLLVAATNASDLLNAEVGSIKTYCGNDLKKITALQDRAMQLFKAGSPLPGPEARVIELIHCREILKAILDYPKARAEIDKLDDEKKRKICIESLDIEIEKKAQTFTGYLNAKIGRGGAKPGRLENYVDKLCKFRCKVLAKKKQADDEDTWRAQHASRNGVKAVEREKTPRSAASADDPEFVKHEQRISSVPPERSSEPPSSKAREPGGLRRFISNPMTWTLMGISGFTSALVYKDSFREIAQGLRMFWHDTLHRPDFEFTRMHIYLGYSGALLFFLSTTEFFRRRAVGKKARLYSDLAKHSREERGREKNIIARLTEITLKHEKWEDQLNQLSILLLGDAHLMEDLYEMKKHSLFNDILADARIHPKLVQNLDLIFDRVKKQKLEKRLNKLAEVVLDPKERIGMLTKYYQEDPVFRRIIDELFEQNAAGNYVNMDKQNNAFAVVLDHNEKNVAKELQKALQNDYIAIKST